MRVLKEVDRLAHRTLYVIRHPAVIKDMVYLKFMSLKPVERYQAWQEVNLWDSRSADSLKKDINNRRGELPLISVIMPVYNPPVLYLDKAIRSVTEQVYDNWELCIVDDCSTAPDVKSTVEKWSRIDKRIRFKLLDKNVNISMATNYGAELAGGEYLIFLDHDDELTPDALGEVVLYLSDHPETDVLYSDDDKITPDGRRYGPQFKPDWSPELLLSYMYFSHIFVVRRSLYQAAGGMRTGFEGSQDYDLALRVTEMARHVGHIPKVLYHWRSLPSSTASSGSAKPESFEAGRRAVQEALDRRGINAKTYRPDFAVNGGLGLFAHKYQDNGPDVTILIPTRNNLKTLRTCLESLRKTTYKNYEVIVIDNESDDPETVSFLKALPHKVIRIPNTSGTFNFAAINNHAANMATSPYILLLNDDTEVQSPGWLSQMMGYAQISGVGAVGAKLLFPDGRIQHAGVIHGLYHGLAGPAFKGTSGLDHGYLSYASVVRNYSAVTAACMLTSRELFLKLGGFDEKLYGVAYNDVDYCYRLIASGYRCVYCPDAVLTHHEGYSRGFKDNPGEIANFRKAYRGFKDPYYSPYLSLDSERFEIIPRRLSTVQNNRIPALMVSHNLKWEGAPYSQYQLTLALKKKGVIDPIVFCQEDGPLREAYEENGIFVDIDNNLAIGALSIKEYNRRLNHLSQKIAQWGIKLVYANTLLTFYAIDTARQVGLPSIWNPRESEPWQNHFNNFGAQIAKRAVECFKFPYRIIFVSDATRDVYKTLNTHHNFTVIPNGLDMSDIEQTYSDWPRDRARTFLNIDKDDVVIFLLGTVTPRKGQHDLPLALSRLPVGCSKKIRCFIVGDRPCEYSQELARIVRKLPGELQDRVSIIPETSEVAHYYRAADIFVCTSRIESYPRVILEAMAYGLPIITTPVFGIREQVRDGVNALLYTPGNITELAEKIELLTTNRELRGSLAANSRNVLDGLPDYEDMVRAYAECFREAWLNKGFSLKTLNRSGTNRIPQNMLRKRCELAERYLTGHGLELGALHSPLQLSNEAFVLYVDRYGTDDLYRCYPELKDQRLVHVDIIDNGEVLSKVENNSQDFIIANHFLEHCENPLGAMRSHLSKLRENGILYYSVPDRMQCFDSSRPLTDFAHFLRDDQEGHEVSRVDHFREWSQLVCKIETMEEIDMYANRLMEDNYSIHFHVWDILTFREYLLKAREYFNNIFKIEYFTQNDTEEIAILRKDSGKKG